VDKLLKESVDKAIADVAKAHKVDPQTVIDAIVAAEKKVIQKLVDEGMITQKAAQAWLAYLPESVRIFVEADWSTEFEEGEVYFVDWFGVAAKAIGIDVDKLLEESIDKAIAEVARARKVDPKTVIDAIVAAEKKVIQKQVDEGMITQKEAQAWLAELPESVREFVEEDWSMPEEIDWGMPMVEPDWGMPMVEPDWSWQMD